MTDDLGKLEHRLDDIESWHDSEEAVKKDRAARRNQRHIYFQISMSIISTLSVLVNLYLVLSHHK